MVSVREILLYCWQNLTNQMEKLIPTKILLKERKETLEKKAQNNKDRRIKDVERAIYCVSWWIKLRINGALSKEDTDKLCEQLQEWHNIKDE